MKRLSLLIISILCCLNGTMAQDDFTSPYFESAEARDEACRHGITIYTEDWSDMPDQSKEYEDFDETAAKYPNLHFRRMRNRRALVGEGCTVNKIITVVGVGGWSKTMNALTNEDLEDYAEFNKVVSAAVTVDPIVSIRDMRNYYAKGTKAGYCIVAGSGNAVLTLDIIKAMSIGFYRDGKLLGVKAVQEGQDGSGVTLKLIQIPGSDEACIMLTAESDWLFDEISLDHSGGVQVGVGDLLKVKYAFVGDSQEYPITHDGTDDSGHTLKGGISQYNDYKAATGNPEASAELDYVKGWDPVLLGIPFPFTDDAMKKLTDYDTSNYIAVTPILTVGYQGGAKFMMKRTDGSSDEVFDKGMEVGFNYNMGSGLALDAGAWIRLILFDRNGNKVQEETVSAGVLNLSVAKGGNGTASVTAQQPFSGCEIRFHTVLSVDLGAIGIHYGFVKNKPEVPHHCPINPSPDTNLCPGQTSFQLRSNPDVSVTWSLEESKPDDETSPAPSVTPTGYASNLSPGYYRFRATATDGCSDEMWLSVGHFGNEDQTCTRPINNGLNNGTYEVSTDIYGSSGSLISASDLQNAEAIVTKSTEDYATYIGGLSLASNLRITGVKRTDGGLIYDATDRHDGESLEEAAARMKPKRMGFVVANFVTGIDLSLLQYLQIRCYHAGKEIYRHVISESNGVQADVATQAGVQRTRYSIEVPETDNDGQPMQVDEIMLWTSGVLNLRGSNLHIYYAFSEDADAACSDPMGCGVTLLSNKKTHTTINADANNNVGVVSVANTVDNLSYLIDDDMSTAMLVLNTVAVGSGQVVAVNVGRTMDYHHQIGIIVDQKTYVANIGVGNWLTVETFYKGNATGDKKSDWSVLGVDVAGYGDKNYLFVQPKHIYDEVRITIAGIVDAAEPQKFYGLFLRGDVDNDGLPDCKDPNSCAQEPLDVAVNKVCVGDTIKIQAKGFVDTDYTIEFGEPGVGEVTLKSDATTGLIDYEYATKTPGRYQMMFYDGSGNFINSVDYTVYPRQTTWLTTASNNDWNKWDNWSDGAPYCCTNVIIPSGAKHYPVLEADEVNTGDEYCCNDIFFEPKSAVERTQQLNYSRAWVEAKMQPNRYYNFSAPLKQMYTGDMFVNTNVATPETFAELTADNYPEQRFNPTVYQRLWLATEKSHKWTMGNGADDYMTVTVDATNWSHHFNNLAYNYPMGGGVAVWVDEGTTGGDAFSFRFPKMHNEYNYYNDYDHTKIDGAKETIERDSILPYRFIYESANDGNLTLSTSDGTSRTVYKAQTEFPITLTADKATTTFMLGNPFMSHIDIGHFLNYNDNVKAVKVELNGAVLTVTRNDDGTFVYNGDVKTIAPMQSVFVETADAATSVNVTLTTDMLSASDDDATPAQTNNAPQLRITAVADSTRTEASLTLVESAAFTSPTLFDNEVRPELSLFAINDGSAYDIMPMEDNVALGLCTSAKRDITFSFRTTNGFERDAYRLKDNLTGMTYSIDGDITIPAADTSIGRFAIVRDGTTSITANSSATDSKTMITIDNGKATVRAAKTIDSIIVCDTAGRISTARSGIGSNTAITEAMPKGINIIKIGFDDGTTQSVKLIR